MTSEVDVQSVRLYLSSRYAGVFNDDQIERHIKDYVGLDIANQELDLILRDNIIGKKILDVGSGFGSFVLAARRRGWDAVGIEIGPYEVEFARDRLRRENNENSNEEVYYLGDGCRLPFGDANFDIVTLWNVVEHVADYEKLISECVRVLRPSGYVYLVCPNYAAFRREAHYGIAWVPLLPRCLARGYLRLRKKKNAFFNNEIFYRTNWGVLYALWKKGLKVSDVRELKMRNMATIGSGRIRGALHVMQKIKLGCLVSSIIRLSMMNPLKNSVAIYAMKGKAYR